MIETTFQPDMFLDETRLPRRPYCSDDLATGVRIRSLQQAITKPYIQINPPHLRVWSIYDVDRPAGALAWEDVLLPAPSWACTNKDNGHAHLVWGIKAPVLVDSPDMRQAPMRYLCAIEAGFREKLQADSGYSGLITKNPKHPQWLLTKLLCTPIYDLDELADWVDLSKHQPKRKPEEVGLGRNVSLFDWLRKYAYRQIRHYKVDVKNFVLWQSHLNNKALVRNGDFLYPLCPKEVWQIVKSVAKWAWRRFDVQASDARFSALQAHRGKLGGKGNTRESQAAKGQSNTAEAQALKGKASALVRWGDNENKQASARIMAAKGMTQRAIADELGVSDRTIRAWLNPEKRK